MGLLDDAIREHLDLKRRRGADPAEVERAEREALGPVRRNRDPAAESEPDTRAAVAEHDPYAQEGEPEWAQGPPTEGWADDAEEEEWGPRPTAGFSDEPRGPESWAGDAEGPESDNWAYDAAEPPPAVARPSTPPRLELSVDSGQHPPEGRGAPRGLDDVGGGETIEYDVGSALDEHDDAEDVLEETPDFLQDAPDHDRLWFEQRPPRDFDFDG
jgi:hypothetical protein